MKAVVLNRVLLVLGLIGIFVAGTLSASHFWNLSPGCGPAGGCEKVLTHPSSMLFGIPVAYLGLGGYLMLTAFAAMRCFMPAEKVNWTVKFGYIFAGAGALFSVYLQFISIFAIQHICPWCMTSAITMLTTFVIYGFLTNALVEGFPLADPFGMKLPTGLGMAFALALFVNVVVMKNRAQSLISGTLAVDNKHEMIPPGAHIYGDPKSPIKLVEFADLLCSHCQDFSPKVHAIVDTHPGKICLVYRHFPLERVHPMANVAACVSEYAAEKMDFFKFTDQVMLIKDPPANADPIMNVAIQFKLDVKDIKARLKDPQDKIYTKIQDDRDAAAKYGVGSTPTFFVFIEGDPKDPQKANHSNLEELLGEPRFTKILNGK